MIKQSITSEYLVNQIASGSFNTYPNTIMRTIKKPLLLAGIGQPPTICNIIALSDEITKDIVNSGSLVKFTYWASDFEQTAPLDHIRVGFFYDINYGDSWETSLPVVIEFSTFSPFVYDRTTNMLDAGFDMITERYSIKNGGDIRNIRVLMWYGLDEIANSPEVLVTPTFNDPVFFAIEQYV